MGNKRGESFFFYMGLVLLALVIAGFAPAVLKRPGGPSSLSPLLVVHGITFLGWYVLFIVQTRLIAAGRSPLHQRMGRGSLALGVLLVILAWLVIRSAMGNPFFSIAGLPRAASTMFPLTDILNFLVVFSLGVANRRKSAAHKRFMLLAGILMIDPAVARIVLMNGAPAPLILGIEVGLLFALLVYDVATRKRPHAATGIGIGLYVSAMLAKLLLAPTDAYQSLAHALFT